MFFLFFFIIFIYHNFIAATAYKRSKFLWSCSSYLFSSICIWQVCLSEVYGSSRKGCLWQKNCLDWWCISSKGYRVIGLIIVAAKLEVRARNFGSSVWFMFHVLQDQGIQLGQPTMKVLIFRSILMIRFSFSSLVDQVCTVRSNISHWTTQILRQKQKRNFSNLQTTY